MNRPRTKPEIAAVCLGVKVPRSQFVDAAMAARIDRAQYEGQEIAGALHVVRPDDTVLELGAGIGLVGAVVARNCKPRAVVSFEANPDLVPVCRALYRANRLRSRISVQNGIVSGDPNRPASLPFHVRPAFRSSSQYRPDSGGFDLIEVPTFGFDEICALHAPTVLIADIEGGELDLLRNANLDGFRALVIEFHPNLYGKVGFDACKAVLLANGFRRVAAKSTRRVWTCERSGR